MDDRPASAESGIAEDERGYPLRDEATEPFPPPPPPGAPPEAGDQFYAAPVEPAEQPPRRRRRLQAASPWPVLLAVLLVLVGLGTAYAVTRPSSTSPPSSASPPLAASAPPAAAPTPPPPRTHKPAAPLAPARPSGAAVPSFVGSSLPHAVSALRRANLTPVVTRIASNAPEGRVVAQRPAAGSKLPEGGRVQLSVSVQPPMAVPDVGGIQGLVAVHRLQGDHLVASVRYVPSTEPARRVVSQWPPAGRKVQRGTSVRLNLSQGLRPTTTVPDVVGEDEGAARSDLAGDGFTVRSVDRPTTDPSQAGVVVDERPGAGTSARHGSSVTIYVARYTGG